jgi:hypothetical protein
MRLPRIPRPRLSIRALMIAIAVLGVIFAVGIAWRRQAKLRAMNQMRDRLIGP